MLVFLWLAFTKVVNIYMVYIILPVAVNCPTWISGRERKNGVEPEADMIHLFWFDSLRPINNLSVM